MEFFEHFRKELRTPKIVASGFVIVLICFGILLNVERALFNFRFLLITVGIPLLFLAFCIWSCLSDRKYKKLMQKVEKIGDAEEIGNRLASIRPNRYAKGDLRLDNDIIFYASNDHLIITVDIIAPIKIKKIEMVVSYYSRVNNSRYAVLLWYQYHAVILESRFLRIEVDDKEKMHRLCDQLKKVYAPHLCDSDNVKKYSN